VLLHQEVIIPLLKTITSKLLSLGQEIIDKKSLFLGGKFIDSMNLTIIPLPSATFVLSNTLVHNFKDFHGQRLAYLRLGDTIYPSQGVGDTQCPRDHLGLSKVHRRWYRRAVNDSIVVERVNPPKITLDRLVVHVHYYRHPHRNHEMPADEFRRAIQDRLEDYYFHPQQILLMKLRGVYYLLKVTSPDGGFLYSKTKIHVLSANPHLTITSPEILQPDFFRSDYNFADLGIGGVNEALSVIFQ
jgi:hypothetical protein